MYEKARPSYPAETIDFLFETFDLASKEILEVGAGTGKFSRLLAERGANLTALEPVAAMRSEFKKILPDVANLEGTSESIPLPSESFGVVIAAQAFHWFDGPAALREFARVLRPEGAVILIWNQRDESEEWSQHLTAIVRPYEQGSPTYRNGAWKKAFETGSAFTALEHRSFRNQQTGGAGMLIERAKSVSFIAALPAEKQRLVEDQIRELVSTHPQLKGKAEIAWHYRTDVYWSHKQ